MRDGCYQIESGGGTGGAGTRATARPAATAPPTSRRSSRASARSRATRWCATTPGGAARPSGARADGLLGGDSQTRVVLIRRTARAGWRRIRRRPTTSLRAVNELPSENQWYATPPANRSARVASWSCCRWSGRRLDGAPKPCSRRTAAGGATAASSASAVPNRKLPGKRVAAVAGCARPARPDPRRGEPGPARRRRARRPDKRSDGVEISVEVAWPGQARAPAAPEAARRRRWPIASAPRCRRCRRPARSRPRRDPR